jgi:hypothetical protein
MVKREEILVGRRGSEQLLDDPYSTNPSRSRARRHRYSRQLPEIGTRNRTDPIERL